jgi:hypothetical protein
MSELGVVLGLMAALCVVCALRHAARPLRIQLAVFNTFYFVTSVIGALLVTNPDFQLIWSLLAGGADVGWLRPGESGRYWILVLAPFVVVNIVALVAYRSFRPLAVATSRNLGLQVSLFSVGCVGAMMIVYCLFNLARHGYLGISLIGSSNAGVFSENIQLRTAMAQELGALHFGIIYMALPAVCITALASAVRARTASWWMMFGVLCLSAVCMYLTTLTKSNLLIFMVALSVAALAFKIIRISGLVLLAGLALVFLTLQDALLTGSGVLEFGGSLANLVMRLSSGIPFYVDMFPEQEPFVGIDYGLGWFGIGPKVAPNLLVFNYMFPDITYVQGAAPAPAHISAYAQAGLTFSLATMAIIGVVLAFFGAVGATARSPLAHSAFVGGAIMCYYMTQADLVGAINVSYGYKWWVFGLLSILAAEVSLRWLLGRPEGSEQRTWKEMVSGRRN